MINNLTSNSNIEYSKENNSTKLQVKINISDTATINPKDEKLDLIELNKKDFNTSKIEPTEIHFKTKDSVGVKISKNDDNMNIIDRKLDEKIPNVQISFPSSEKITYTNLKDELKPSSIANQNLANVRVSGVSINAPSANQNIFPSIMVNSAYTPPGSNTSIPANPTYRPLKPENLTPSLQGVSDAVSCYPDDFVRRIIPSGVNVVDNFQFYGRNYGGTYLPIVRGNNDKPQLFISSAVNNPYWAFTTLHHELSSYVLLNETGGYPDAPFLASWNAQNPPNFSYRGSGIDALGNEADPLGFNNQLWEQGFVCNYATYNQEEDFNTLSQNLFNDNFWKKLDASPEKYKALREKVSLVIRAYNNMYLDKGGNPPPPFSEDYFRKRAVSNNMIK